MKIINIIKQYLCENGYDGLTDGFYCHCGLEDLFSCDCIQSACRPGYKQPCNCTEQQHDFHIVPPENEIEPESDLIEDYHDVTIEEDEDDLF